jgi:hypothetical protein
MKGYRWIEWGIVLAIGLLIAGLPGSAIAADAKLVVTPNKTVLSPALIKKPIQFTGSGFGAKELVTVELVVPPGVTVKTVPKDEDVGLAFGKADDKGAFTTKMHPVSTLNWFFQVGWTPNMKPDFKQAKPLPPGKYQIKAEGMISGKTAKATLEFLKPPPKAKKK